MRKAEDINVLVACEESQAVCIAFRERGLNAFSNDIQECSGGHPEWHIKGDAIEALNSRNWDLVIAHPPCTYLSKASACRLYPKSGQMDQARYEKGLEARDFFMTFYNYSKCPIVVENPVSLKIFGLPKFSQEIEPYHYGHPVSKKTRLWVHGLPLLKPTDVVEKKGTHLPSNVSSNAYTGKNDNCTRDPKVASKTFSGIAKAMAQQWGDYLLQQPLSQER